MSLKKINIAVVGATGFAGLDLVLLLSKHPYVNIKYLSATKSINKDIRLFDKRIKKTLPTISKIENIKLSNLDLIFLSLPNGKAQNYINKNFLKFKNLRYIDISADFRIDNPNLYKKWYNQKHKATKLIKYSKYSISEIIGKKIKNYKIISNPGCYPTSIQLPLIPLIKKKLINIKKIIIDSKSGYSGAGKKYKEKFKYKNFHDSVHAYGIIKHRHMSEIDQELKKLTKNEIKYIFNPHIIPTFRGILSSIYLKTLNRTSANNVLSELKKFYKKNKFIKILPLNSELGTENVIGTNNCEISVCNTRYKNQIVIFSAIDNLIKGASGQAIQNMNLLFNLNETTGLQ